MAEYKMRGFCVNIDPAQRVIVSGTGKGFFTTFGRMRAARELMHMSCQDLAEKLGVHRVSIWRWERDDIRTIDKDVIAKWAEACKVDITWLVDGGSSGNVALDWRAAKYGYQRKEPFHFYTA